MWGKAAFSNIYIYIYTSQDTGQTGRHQCEVDAKVQTNKKKSRDERHRDCRQRTCFRSVRSLHRLTLQLVLTRISFFFSWIEVPGREGKKIKNKTKRKKNKKPKRCPHWSHFLSFTANSSVLSSYFSPRAAEHRAPGLFLGFPPLSLHWYMALSERKIPINPCYILEDLHTAELLEVQALALNWSQRHLFKTMFGCWKDSCLWGEIRFSYVNNLQPQVGPCWAQVTTD